MKTFRRLLNRYYARSPVTAEKFYARAFYIYIYIGNGGWYTRHVCTRITRNLRNRERITGVARTGRETFVVVRAFRSKADNEKRCRADRTYIFSTICCAETNATETVVTFARVRRIVNTRPATIPFGAIVSTETFVGASRRDVSKP